MFKFIQKLYFAIVNLFCSKEIKSTEKKKKIDEFYSLENAAKILYHKSNPKGSIEVSNAMLYSIFNGKINSEDPNYQIIEYIEKLQDFLKDGFIVGIDDVYKYPGYYIDKNSENYAESIFFSQDLASDENRFPKTMRINASFYSLAYIEDGKPGAIESSTRRINLVLSPKAQKEFIQAIVKARNLYDRFTGILERIVLVPMNENNEYILNGVVDSIGLAIEYKLLDETKFFMAYYKSNILKKKLNGAAITASNVLEEFSVAANKINKIWRDNGSNLHLHVSLTEPAKTTLNGQHFITTLKPRYALIRDLCSEEFYDAMVNLLNHDVYLVKVDDGTQLVMDPKVNTNGFIEFKPIFKMDTTILAVSIAATKLHSRAKHDIR